MLRKLIGLMAVAVMLCASVVMAEEIKGKITKVDVDKKTVTVSVDGKETTYDVADDAKLPGKEGKNTLKDLQGRVEKAKDGLKATVTTTKKGTKEVVTEVKQEKAKAKDKDKDKK